MIKARQKVLDLPVARLPRDTLQEQVFRQLSDMILDGEIVPGQLVTIQALADAFGVSTMPVREALKSLTAAKALTTVSGRSIGIPPLNIDRLDDLHRVRIEIESIAAEWSAPNIDDDGIEALVDQLSRMESATAAGDVKVYLRANRAFHFIIYGAAGSEALLSFIESLWLQISPFFSLLHGSGNYAVSNKQHEVMLNAIRAGDIPTLKAAVRADIDGAYDVLAGLLR